MHRVKIFSGEESHSDDLEREINDWLSKTGVRVISITGNIAPQTVLNPDRFTRVAGEPPGYTRELHSSDLVVIVLYEVPEVPAGSAG
jgi:hypothetical protein